jgi:P pilus assembly chaperone PapD
MNFLHKLFPKIILGLVAAFFLQVVFCFNYVSAQEDFVVQEGVQISPTRIDIDLNVINEDGYYEGIINLKNYEDTSYRVRVEIEDFYVSDDSTQAMFFVPQENHPLKAYDMINWIEVDKEIFMNPKESKNIPIKIRVPQKTPTGGYYGAIFFKSDRYDAELLEKDEGNDSFTTKVGIKQRVGMLLTIAVKGVEPIKREAEITVFEPEKKLFWQAPAKLKLNIHNKGNIHFKVTGNIKIDKFGIINVAEGEFNERILYPEKDRAYDFDWNFSNWSYGFYKAVVEFTSEDGEIKMSDEATFWVIPWKTTLSIIILLIIIWLIFRIFTSRFEIRRKGDNEEEESGEDIYSNESGEFIDEDLRFKR